jgi:hypothetical protein
LVTASTTTAPVFTFTKTNTTDSSVLTLKNLSLRPITGIKIVTIFDNTAPNLVGVTAKISKTQLNSSEIVPITIQINSTGFVPVTKVDLLVMSAEGATFRYTTYVTGNYYFVTYFLKKINRS